MTDTSYSDADVARLYDTLNPWGPADDFYLGLVMKAASVLDVGCGTGTLLHRARAEGHGGRLAGIDPDPAMLDLARRQADIEWVGGTAAAMAWDRDFDLAVMTGHAFQFLVTDDDLRISLAAIRHALADNGRFVFETRNPAVREWTEWHPGNPIDTVDPAGRDLRISYEVEAVDRDVITLTETTAARDGPVLRVDRAGLRFLAPDALSHFLTEAGFAIEIQHGGWHGEALALDSREIVTVARRTAAAGR